MDVLAFLFRGSVAAVGLALGLSLAPALADQAVRPPDDGPGVLGLAVGNDALRYQPALDLRAEFSDYAKLGARWLRVDLWWAQVQTAGPDSYDWSLMDTYVDLAARANLRLLPVVGTVPAWSEGGNAPTTPEALDAFTRFLTAAVERYQPKGIRVWEIWNEPNMAGFWLPAPDPVAYARLLKASHAAVKAADPEALVLSGGLSPAPDTGPAEKLDHIAAADFLAAVYAEGAGDSFDALGFHPYSWPLMPSDPAPWQGWTLMTGPIRALMEKHGDGDKRIWMTEYGAPTNPGSGVAEAAQAAMLAEAADLARSYPWAGPLLWYSYRNLGTDPANSEDWYGVVDSARAPKPVYLTFRSLALPPG